jgi:trk system potassium uptake protein TrkA
MKIIIMGCGRRGAQLAYMLQQEGHEVTVLDSSEEAFDDEGFLPEDFSGTKMIGNGMDRDDLRRAGAEHADAFISATRGDNRNVMAAQIAKHIFGIPRVVTLVHDPIRAEIYQSLGLRAVSPTRAAAGLLKEALEREEDEPVAGSPADT